MPPQHSETLLTFSRVAPGAIVVLGLLIRDYPLDQVMFSHAGLTAAATHGAERHSTDRPNLAEFPSHRAMHDLGMTWASPARNAPAMWSD
jgi:hypothetical protein